MTPSLPEAYASGWASSGGPLTERVKAGMRAVAELEQAPTPEVLEATLRLGHLEGTWAAKFDRWEKLLGKHLEQVKAQWRKLTKLVDLDLLATAARAKAGLGEAAAPDIPTGGQAVTADEIATLALAALRGMSTDVEGFATLLQLVDTSLTDAAAEGQAAALALAADDAGAIGFDFDLAFEDMRKRLETLGGWVRQDAWLAQALDGTATDLGREWARLLKDGASHSDMVKAAADLLGGQDLKALTYAVDMAFGQAMSGGAIDLWTSEGVQTVNYVTAGDDRVCATCEDAEIGSPYSVGDCPQPPLHGFCRCVLQANDAIPTSAFARYVSDTLDQN